MRRPVAYAVVIVVSLLVVGSLFLGASWGSVDYRVLPQDAPAHVAADKLNSEFGTETSTANVMLTAAENGDVDAYATQVRDIGGVTDVQPVDQAGDTTLLRVFWEGNTQSEASQQIVADLRALDIPGETTALVGGLSADTVDLLASIGEHLPWMGLIVVGVMLLLLFLAFGSLVLPVKAILMNAVSITTSTPPNRS